MIGHIQAHFMDSGMEAADAITPGYMDVDANMRRGISEAEVNVK